MRTYKGPIDKEVMEQCILAKLVRGLNLTKEQVQYVKQEIEPKYDNDCSICRLNAAVGLGLTEKEAIKSVSIYEERNLTGRKNHVS